MNLRSVRILPRGIFNHTPLAGWGAGYQAQQPTWRLNIWYLKSLECAEFVEEELEAFFRCNEGLVDSKATLRAACKPTMHGIIKSYIRGQEQSQSAQLEAKILELEGQTRHLDTQAVQHQLALAWSA
ncbi:hypothetical protein NDU88_001231 [Pleurodeles waltl]|uniref:Uncharacterized protein n=1 Tax=Pleurodeles waltl TaxID=8319 RepID=A0AAV7TIK8_PLEWA|nr:hypothetical protein NDU88_001231 [Pleurodeles waltl]